MSESVPNLLVIGGAHVDRLARLKAPHIAQTSNPASISESVGGGSFNAARASKRFDLNISMLSARGGDAGGELVAQAIKSAGIIDLSSVHMDRPTPSYTAILEPDGELVTAIADMELYETSITRSFRRAPVQNAAAKARAILCDANLTDLALLGVFNEVAHGKPVYALAISATKVARFSRLLPNIACLFLNRFEAAALTGLPASSSTSDFAEVLRERQLFRCAITAGAEPAAFLDGQSITRIEPPKTKLVDVTGAGDCLAGTMIAALLSGFDFIECAKLGLAAASLTASKHGAAPVINIKEIKTLTATHNWNVT